MKFKGSTFNQLKEQETIKFSTCEIYPFSNLLKFVCLKSYNFVCKTPIIYLQTSTLTRPKQPFAWTKTQRYRFDVSKKNALSYDRSSCFLYKCHLFDTTTSNKSAKITKLKFYYTDKSLNEILECSVPTDCYSYVLHQNIHILEYQSALMTHLQVAHVDLSK